MKPVTYAVVYAALLAATVIEVALFFQPLAATVTSTIILLLATFKAVLIGMFYMHLKYEPLPVASIPLVALAALSAFIIAAMVTMAT